jgi:hypothetical protein
MIVDWLVPAVGAVGAWFLVAGPVYQAALELREQELDHEGFEAAKSSVAPPPKMSPWWWLLPPVAYFIQRSKSNAFRRAVMDALGPEQLEQTVSFLNKANGWLMVATGAFLIAVKETWEFHEALHWPIWAFVVTVIVVALFCLANAGLQISRSNRMLKRDEEASAERRRVRP